MLSSQIDIQNTSFGDSMTNVQMQLDDPCRPKWMMFTVVLFFGGFCFCVMLRYYSCCSDVTYDGDGQGDDKDAADGAHGAAQATQRRLGGDIAVAHLATQLQRLK